MSGTVLGSGDTAENKIDQNPCLGGADIPGWGGCGGWDAFKAHCRKIKKKVSFFFFGLQGTRTNVLFPGPLCYPKCVSQVVNELLTNV